MIRVGIIGHGYWGPNMVRNFSECSYSLVSHVSVTRQEKFDIVRKRYPEIKVTMDYNDMLSDSCVDAVAIATPVSTHFDIAMRAIRAGKHVLIEKPMTATSKQAIELIEEAEKYKRVLLVDHTFIYTEAVRKINDLIKSDTLGDLYYYDSVRTNLGVFQRDANVMWDLAVHDLSIMDYIKMRPKAVSAIGAKHVGNMEDVSYLTLFCEGSLIAHVHTSWLSPRKTRNITISGSKKMIFYDDLEFIEKIKVYDSGAMINDKLFDYRIGDVLIPSLKLVEALSVEVEHFVRCIEGKENPLTDGKSGLRVVRILEAANDSMMHCGKVIEI